MHRTFVIRRLNEMCIRDRLYEKKPNRNNEMKTMKIRQKRQRKLMNTREGLETVSYTHLDVYKRQVLYSIYIYDICTVS